MRRFNLRTDTTFFVVSAVIVVASIAATITWSLSMARMAMPGQSRTQPLATFLGIWEVMMVAMMMPSLYPTIWRYRRSVSSTRGIPRDALVGAVGAGYFAVWAAAGGMVFLLDALVAAMVARNSSLARLAPGLAGIAVALSGAVQLTAWKRRHLACCVVAGGGEGRPFRAVGGAIRSGVGLGFHCVCSSGALMSILVVAGMMNLGLMAAVTVAITAERVAPESAGLSRAIGIAAVLGGLLWSLKTLVVPY